MKRLVVPMVLIVLLVGGCSGEHARSASDTTATTAVTGTTEVAATTETTADPATTLPAGTTKGYDDRDQDGQPDPICRTQDFGGGLVLQVPCNAATFANHIDGDVTLVKDSLAGLPAVNSAGFTGQSGGLIQGRDPAGKEVVVALFSTDVLFATGSATLSNDAPPSFDAVISGVNQQYPNAQIQVRGHTDSVGTAAGNQALSERRATSARDYLVSHGLKAAGVATLGFGSTRPICEEKKADGSDSPVGRLANRRVEIVIRT